DAFENRDAANLLPHENAGDTPHPDAAQDDDDKADQGEEIFGALEAFTNLILGRSIRPCGNKAIAEAVADLAGESIDDVLPHLEQQLVGGTAAERQESRLLQIGKIDEHSRTEREPAHPA